jgi:thioredoxin-related protein
MTERGPCAGGCPVSLERRGERSTLEGMKAAMLWMVAVLFAVGGVVGHAAGPEAQTDLEAALKTARAEKKLLFVVYGREGCGNCRALRSYISERTVRLPSSEFVYAFLNCDDPKQSRLFSQHYRVGGPTLPFVVVSDAEGHEIAGRTGYGKPEEFNALIKSARKEGAKVASARPAGAAEPVAEASEETRTWTPRNAQAFRAVVMQASGGLVVLKREDGSKRSYPVTVFSDDDQRFIRELVEASKKK